METKKGHTEKREPPRDVIKSFSFPLFFFRLDPKICSGGGRIWPIFAHFDRSLSHFSFKFLSFGVSFSSFILSDRRGRGEREIEKEREGEERERERERREREREKVGRMWRR